MFYLPPVRGNSAVIGQVSACIPVVGKAGIPEGALLKVMCPGIKDWIAGKLFSPAIFVMAAC
jgi:hypothetical protein